MTKNTSIIFPCWKCGAPDSRQPDHAQGCPQLEPVSKESLIELARKVEEGWAKR